MAAFGNQYGIDLGAIDTAGNAFVDQRQRQQINALSLQNAQQQQRDRNALSAAGPQITSTDPAQREQGYKLLSDQPELVMKLRSLARGEDKERIATVADATGRAAVGLSSLSDEQLAEHWPAAVSALEAKVGHPAVQWRQAQTPQQMRQVLDGSIADAQTVTQALSSKEKSREFDVRQAEVASKDKATAAQREITNSLAKQNLDLNRQRTNFQTGGGPAAANTPPVGVVGHSEIDATAPGYSSSVVGNSGLTQASIDQKALSYFTSGTLPPQGRTGVSGIQNAAISNRMAELGQNANLASNKSQLKSLTASLGTQQKYLDTTQRALNTANDTLDALQTYMQKNNINPSQFPDYNRFVNFLKSKGIDPGTAGGYNAQIATLRQEYSQVLAKGGVRSVETDREAAKLIPDGLSPKDLAKVAAQIKVDSDNVVNDAQKQVAQIGDQINNIGKPKAAKATKPPADASPDDLVKFYNGSP